MMTQDLYFYKGKFRTENGIKRELIKDGTIDVSPLCTYYAWDKQFEYFYDFDYLRDLCYDNELITKEEYKHFRKFLNKKIKDGEIRTYYGRYYSSEYKDGIGFDWWETFECIRQSLDWWDPRNPDDFIEEVENTVEAYSDTVSQETWDKFLKLSDEEQNKIAMKWRINEYKKAVEEQLLK